MLRQLVNGVVVLALLVGSAVEAPHIVQLLMGRQAADVQQPLDAYTNSVFLPLISSGSGSGAFQGETFTILPGLLQRVPFLGGRVQLSAPARAFSEPSEVRFAEVSPMLLTEGFNTGLAFFEIAGSVPPAEPLGVRFSYSEPVEGNESQYGLYAWDEQSGSWFLLPGQVDTTANAVIAAVSSYGRFALLEAQECAGCVTGDPSDTIPPVIAFSNVSQDERGNISIAARITDNSGAVSSVQVGDVTAGLLVSPPAPSPVFGQDVWTVIFSELPGNYIFDFTLVASDASGNASVLPGSIYIPGADHPTDSYLLSRGTYHLPWPLFTLPGPGDSDIKMALSYYARPAQPGLLGDNWVFPYSSGLHEINDPLIVGVVVTYPGGQSVHFVENGSGYTPIDPVRRDRLEKTGSGYLLTLLPSRTLRFYDASGKMTSQLDRNANRIDFTYNGDQLTRIENSARRAVEMEYDGQGRISAITAAGKRYSLRYEDQFLAGITNANGSEWQFEYTRHSLGTLLNGTGLAYSDTIALLTGVLNPLGSYKYQQGYNERAYLAWQTTGGRQRLEYQYDPVARKTLVTDAYGNTTSYTFDLLERLVERVDPDGLGEVFGYEGYLRTYWRDRAGREWAWTYDERGNRTSESGPDGWQRTWEYNNLDLPVRAVEHVDGAAERASTFTYDAKGNLTRTVNPLGYEINITVNLRGEPSRFSDYAGDLTFFGYDNKGDRTFSTDGLGQRQTFYYDEFGRLVKKVTPLGHTYEYTYDAEDLLTAVTGPLGYHLGYIYDAAGRKTVEVDANRGQTVFTYDDADQITSITDALGGTTSFTYGAMSEQTGKVDAEGRAWTYTYDALLRLSEVSGPLNSRSLYRYDAAGNVAEEVDAEGRVKYTEYDGLNRPVRMVENYRPGQGESADINITTRFEYTIPGDLLRETDPEGYVTEYTHDLLGRVTRKRSPLGAEWIYEYDPRGNLLREIDPLGNATTNTYDVASQRIARTDALGGVTAYTYDLEGNLVEVTDPLGIVTRYEYDALNRKVREIANYRPSEPANESTNVASNYTYDLAGNLTSLTNPVGRTQSFQFDALGRKTGEVDFTGAVTTYTYDRVGNQRTITDPNGQVTTMAYDGLDRVTAETNPEGHTKRTQYNLRGDIIAKTDAAGSTTIYMLDSMGRPVQVIDALGGMRTYSYNRLGWLTVQTDANGNTRSTAYDAGGNAVVLTDGEGFASYQEWDAAGNLAATTDANGSTNRMAYDALNRLVSRSNGAAETERFTYDAVGSLLRHETADGKITRYEYDPLRRLAAVIENAKDGEPATGDTNVTTRYQYNATGQCIEIQDPNGSITRISRDGMGRVMSETNALGATWAYEWDGAGNLLARLDANGSLTRYTYLPDNMLARIDYTNGSAVAFEYDEENRLVRMQDTLGTTQWTRDALGRAIRQVDPLGQALAMVYDPAGNRTALTYPNTLTVSYRYDRNNQVQAVVNPQGSETVYGRDSGGRITGIWYADAISAQISYDAANRVTKLHYQQEQGSKKVIAAFDYQYTPAGLLDHVTAQYGWRLPEWVVEHYRYDGLGRLSGFANSDGLVMAYSYDAAGNRLSWQTNDNPVTPQPNDGFTTQYRYNAAGQMLEAFTNGQGSSFFEYDSNGNRVRQVIEEQKGSSARIDYTYDDENRLVITQAYRQNGARAAEAGQTVLVYDGSGRRLISIYNQNSGEGNEERNVYAFDGYDEISIQEKHNGQYDNIYYDGQGQKLALHSFPSGQLEWYQYNAFGSIVGITRDSGQAIHNYRYDPFGLIIPENGNFTEPHNEYTYGGQPLDPPTGLYLFGTRHYDPLTGTWLNTDFPLLAIWK